MKFYEDTNNDKRGFILSGLVFFMNRSHSVALRIYLGMSHKGLWTPLWELAKFFSDQSSIHGWLDHV